MTTAAHLAISPNAMDWRVRPDPNPATLALAQRMRHVCTQRVMWEEFIAYADRIDVPKPFNVEHEGRRLSADWFTAWRIVQLGDHAAGLVAKAISATADAKLDLSKPDASPAHEAARHVLSAVLTLVNNGGPRWERAE